MVFISKKRIRGVERHYIEKSARMADGSIKKFSVYLSGYPGSKDFDMAETEKKLNQLLNSAKSEFAVKYYEHSVIFDAATIKKIEDIKNEYGGLVLKFTKKQHQDVIDRFTANFTYESNAIEGNSLTLKDVTLVLHEGKMAAGRDLREVYETLNTRKAMELIFAKKLRITEKDIIKLHKIVISNTGVSEGYKKLPNFLIGRRLATTAPENVEKEMRNLVKWYHEAVKMHPLQKAALFHGKFERIHPFEDGNGRVGRLLINAMLMNKGYPPLIIRKSHRLSYFSALEAFDNGYKEKLYRFLVEKYKKTYEGFYKIYVKYL